MSLRSYAALAFILVGPACGKAADLAKLDRAIAKEPVYQGKPKYCLLVFGPEAKTRIWLVVDGDVAYLDRNANGDLTEAGEKANRKKMEDNPFRDADQIFELGDIQAERLLHRNLRVTFIPLDSFADSDHKIKTHLAKNPGARGVYIGLEAEIPGIQGFGGRANQGAGDSDFDGYLMFGSSPKDAPVVHFGGPWQMVFRNAEKWTIGRETEPVIWLATPGVGPGTTVRTEYNNVVPEDVNPVLEVTFPLAKEGDKPIKEVVEIKKRC